MEETKHTRGPWSFEYGAIYSHGSQDSIRLILADREEIGTSPTERDANLRLAAAAPELLEAVEEAHGLLVDVDNLTGQERSEAVAKCLEHLAAATNKAEGSE